MDCYLLIPFEKYSCMLTLLVFSSTFIFQRELLHAFDQVLYADNDASLLFTVVECQEKDVN